MNTPSAGHKFEAATKAGEPVGSAVAGPDWEKIEHAVECPLCRYNLRGLSEARCPECGFTFEWREILDITRRKHPYLFEHHPERNVWSFCRTLVGGLNPWIFWRTLHPAQAADERRLTAYRWMAKGIASLPLVVSGLWLLMMSMSWPVNDWPRQSVFYPEEPGIDFITHQYLFPSPNENSQTSPFLTKRFRTTCREARNWVNRRLSNPIDKT